jgi:hypothetical protein
LGCDGFFQRDKTSGTHPKYAAASYFLTQTAIDVGEDVGLDLFMVEALLLGFIVFVPGRKVGRNLVSKG